MLRILRIQAADLGAVLRSLSFVSEMQMRNRTKRDPIRGKQAKNAMTYSHARDSCCCVGNGCVTLDLDCENTRPSLL